MKKKQINNDKFKLMLAQSDSCAICGQQPEDMLILSCCHNLCIDCATQIFALSSHPSTLTCEICLAETPLDEDTINCLGSLSARTSPAPLKIIEQYPPRQHKENKASHCKQHRQKTLYFCFDCESSNICSQCILSSTHSGHKVLTLKKAVQAIYDRVGENSRELQEVKRGLGQEAQILVGRKEQFVEEYQERQAKLKGIFDGMIGAISSRFAQLSAQLEKISRRSIELLQGGLAAIAEKSQLIDESLRINRQIMQKQEHETIFSRLPFLQIEGDKYKPQLPSLNNHNTIELTFEHTHMNTIQQILRSIEWRNTNKVQKENQKQWGNQWDLRDLGEVSALGISTKKQGNRPELWDNKARNSRRLQLSRSMDNAALIINKLQERLKR